jgi:hypothetical protein
VLPKGRGEVTAIECKWRAGLFEPYCLSAFRKAYPKGASYVVCADVPQPFMRKVAGHDVEFLNLEQLIARLMAK